MIALTLRSLNSLHIWSHGHKVSGHAFARAHMGLSLSLRREFSPSLAFWRQTIKLIDCRISDFLPVRTLAHVDCRPFRIGLRQLLLTRCYQFGRQQVNRIVWLLSKRLKAVLMMIWLPIISLLGVCGSAKPRGSLELFSGQRGDGKSKLAIYSSITIHGNDI